jgi:D-alanyl-D-alanine dipeptidase
MRHLNWFTPILLTAMELASPAAAQTMPGGLVHLGDIDPSIIQDIRYAGSKFHLPAGGRRTLLSERDNPE